MRIKFLSVIVSFLMVSIVVSSCLDSDENYEYSSDATIHAFGLDTVFSKHYKFSIDQLNRLIYNQDSMPVGSNSDTILGRILIKSFDVTGWVSAGSPTDTVLVMKDSVNLIPAINKAGQSGMEFTVHAADMITTRKYHLDVRVHQQDPDSLNWTKVDAFAETAIQEVPKVVILDNNLLVYISYTTAYRRSALPLANGWSKLSLSNLPSNAKLSSLINFQEKLYMITEGGDVYSSSDGSIWGKVNGLSTDVKALVACFSENQLNDQAAILVGIQKNNDGLNQFCFTKDGQTWSTEGTEIVPDGFPTENIYYTALTTANGVDKVVITGMPQTTDKQTKLWFSMDGKGWADLNTGSTPSTVCPAMTNPFVTYYGDSFYCFGGNMDAIYSSIAGIAWFKTEKKFLLNETFKGKTPYTIVVDPVTTNLDDRRGYIWVIFGGKGTENEVWRGRLNRLGFEQQ